MRPVNDDRPSAFPLPLPDELERRRLLDRLAARWQHPLTLVVADAGFGKSTMLAQAVRTNALEPRGIDVWYSCTPGDADASRVGDALLTALDVTNRRPDLVGSLIDALADYSPIDVCLIIDDAHEITRGSSGADVIGRLLRRLPENAHLVIAGRQAPACAVSRLRAADRLVEISQDDLMFTRDETNLLAARHGRDPKAAAALGGWPALVRLALASHPDVAINFAQEEVLSRLSSLDRRTLFALSNLGYADHEKIRAIVGADIDLEHLAATIPLVTRTQDGFFRAHDLWSTALTNVLDDEQTTELRTRIIGRLIADGDFARAGTIAVTHKDFDALGRIALETVSCTIAALPIDTVRPWTRLLQQHRPGAPSTRLLQAALDQALDFANDAVDHDVDAAIEGFRALDRPADEITAISVGAIAAYARGDTARLLEVARRGQAIPTARDHPIINLTLHAIAAVVAEMSGDLSRALDELSAANLDNVPPAIGATANRLRIHCLLLSGRAGEAADVATKMLTKRNDAANRYLCAVARWMAGQPADLMALSRPTVDFPARNSRDEFVRRTVVASMLASTGRGDAVHHIVESNDPNHLVRDHADDTRDAVLDAVARALCAIMDHDEDRAKPGLQAVLDRHAASPILDQHLLRFFSIGYVLNPQLQARWDHAELGPTHERTRRATRLFVDLRAGHRVAPCDLDPAQVFTAFPLPWTIELACRLHANRNPIGTQLGAWLIDQVPEPARNELRFLAAGAAITGSATVARAAGDLLSHLPAVPTQRIEISVLGPLRVAFDGAIAASAEIRRARVRTLLALLVVHESLSRDRAIDLLWPDLDVRDGARNLRVNLTYLRQLLEPERPTGEAAFHLRADSATLSLHPSEHLLVDLWELRRLTNEAKVSRGVGDLDRTIALLSAATSYWRGDPLSDLGSVVGEDHEVEHARLMQLDALLDLGELRLSRGQTASAWHEAERALALDLYSERAHRLAIAAALHGRDQQRTDIAADRVMTMLDELGADPEPTTKILLRQASLTGTH